MQLGTSATGELMLSKAGIAVLSLLFFATLTASFMVGVEASPITWIIETVDASANVGEHSSITIDSDGFPHIAYYDSHWHNLKYATPSRISPGWLIEPVDTPGDVGSQPSLALDSNDRPHISYRDNSNEALKYAQHTGTAWSIETVDPLAGYHSSLVLDVNDRPHISSVQGSSVGGRLKYAQWTGSTWSIEFVGTEQYFYGTSLALDADGYPHISSANGVYDGHMYVHWTGSAWSFETIDTESGGWIWHATSLGLDSEDKPHISYIDTDNGNLKYAWWTGSLWNIETVEACGTPYMSLALDVNDRPHISYIDEDTDDLKYAWWTGSAWSIETVDAEGTLGGIISLALDAEGKPHISYYDETNGNLKYASNPNEIFASVNVTPFDSDSDEQNDAVEIQMDVDTLNRARGVHGYYSGTVPVQVNAFLVDIHGFHADYNSTIWSVTDGVSDWRTIALSVPPGYFDGYASTYSVELSLFDEDGFFEDFHHETGLYLYPRSAPSVAFIESCNAMAERKDVFELGETVYVYGNGFSPSTEYSVYVVVDQEIWTDGMPIPERVEGTQLGVSSNTEGGISPTTVWHDPQTVGNYDIAVDVNGNGHYDEGVDALDDADVEGAAGVSVIPEFPTILPFFILATSLAAILLRRKVHQ